MSVSEQTVEDLDEKLNELSDSFIADYKVLQAKWVGQCEFIEKEFNDIPEHLAKACVAQFHERLRKAGVL